MKRIIFLLLSLSIVILSNCNQSDELANRSRNIIQPTETLDPKFGVVIGRLLLSSGNAHIPARNQILYLAELISSDDVNNEPSFAAFDRVNSPRTVTTEEGWFRFNRIEPGSYALILDVISNSYLLAKPGTQEPIIITVIGGDVIDLGVLKYDELPINNIK